MNLAKIEVNTFGGSPFAEHNMPCAICREKHAVLNLGGGAMEPCWGCQKEGARTYRFTKGSFVLWLVDWVMS